MTQEEGQRGNNIIQEPRGNTESIYLIWIILSWVSHPLYNNFCKLYTKDTFSIITKHYITLYLIPFPRPLFDCPIYIPNNQEANPKLLTLFYTEVVFLT